MHVIFASYGNDSIALIQWAKNYGIGEAIVAYSDTGWAAKQWPERVNKAEDWVRSLGYTTHRIASEGMTDLVRRKKAWPRGGGGKFQFCTHNLKEAPALRWLEKIDPDRDAICMIGIRREAMRSLRNKGWTYARIGQLHRISRQRVQAILARP